MNREIAWLISVKIMRPDYEIWLRLRHCGCSNSSTGKNALIWSSKTTLMSSSKRFISPLRIHVLRSISGQGIMGLGPDQHSNPWQQSSLAFIFLLKWPNFTLNILNSDVHWSSISSPNHGLPKWLLSIDNTFIVMDSTAITLKASVVQLNSYYQCYYYYYSTAIDNIYSVW